MNFIRTCTLCGAASVRRPWTWGRCRPRTLMIFRSTTSMNSPGSVYVIDASRIRNIGIVAHIDAGKTTTTERMLFYAGKSRTLGEVDHGDTITDYMEQERARGITITSAAVTFGWRGHRFNLIDTPGHVDFTMEVERSLRVLDGAVAVLDASAGVEAQTLTVWRQADRHAVPRIVYLNKMDKRNADVRLCLDSIRNKFDVKPLLLHLPLMQAEGFAGVVDLVGMDKVVWPLQTSSSDLGRTFHRLKLQSDAQLEDQAKRARLELIEELANIDDRMADVLLAADVGAEVDIVEDELKKAIRRVTIERKAVPVFCGSSYKNVAVQLLLDAVVDFLPSPSGRSLGDHQQQLCGLVFKICHDKQMGRLAFVRVYTGALEQGQRVHNLNRRTTERPTKLLRAFADDFRPIAEASAGDIVVLAGTKNVVTGDTLVSADFDSSSSSSHQRANLLAGVQVPPPVFFCSIEAASLAHQKPMEMALEQLRVEDPSLGVRLDADTGQIIVSGLGELHMEIVKDRLLKEHKVRADFGPLQVAYREVVQVQSGEKVSNELEHVFDKTVGSSRQRVLLRLSLDVGPPDDNEGNVLVKIDEVKLRLARTKENQENLDGVRPEHLAALETGLRSSLTNGPIIACPVTNVSSVALHWFQVSGSGSRAAVAASTTVIAAVASQCVSRLLQMADVRLAEPLMLLEIVMPSDDGTATMSTSASVGRVLADLSTRRARILEVCDRRSAEAHDQSAAPAVNVVRALVPLAEMAAYSTALRTITSGRATFTVEFHAYDLMTERDQQLAVKKTTGFL